MAHKVKRYTNRNASREASSVLPGDRREDAQKWVARRLGVDLDRVNITQHGTDILAEVRRPDDHPEPGEDIYPVPRDFDIPVTA